MHEDLGERFLRANANKDYIGQQFTEVVRNLMRAIGSTSYPEQAVGRAAEQMGLVVDLLRHASEPVSFRDLFARAAEELGQIEPNGTSRDDIIDAAQVGISLLAEVTSSDGPAAGRVAKREREFLLALKNVADSHPRMPRQ